MLAANAKLCAVVDFSKSGNLSGKDVLGHESLPVLYFYCYLGIEFSNNGSKGKHIKMLIMHNMKRLGTCIRLYII